jgi:hypothetical protein
VIVDCLENQFASHDLCNENHEQQVEARVRALLAFVDSTPLGKVRPCDIHKLVNSLKLRKACGFDGIPNECLGHLFNYYLLLSHFTKPWKEVKVRMLQ